MLIDKVSLCICKHNFRQAYQHLVSEKQKWNVDHGFFHHRGDHVPSLYFYLKLALHLLRVELSYDLDLLVTVNCVGCCNLCLSSLRHIDVNAHFSTFL